MKICFVSPYSSRGGSELSLIDLIDALLPLGIECSCVVRAPGALCEMLEERGVEPIVAPFKPWVHPPRSLLGRLRKMSPIRHASGACRVAAAVQRSGADVVYTNSATAGAGAMAARMTGKPHVWHFREFGFDDYGLRYDLGRLTSQYLMRQLSTVVIANSKAVADAYRPFLGKVELHVVYNAVDVSPITDAVPTDSPFRRDETLRCLLLGKVLPGKGQEDAVRAMASLAERGVPAELVLAGETLDERYRRYLDGLIEHLGVADSVRLLGHCDQPTSLIHCADVMLMCSRREAFGRVTVEGMKLGKPVVGTRSGGTPEIVEHGVTGLLYDPGDWQTLADEIARLQANPLLRVTLGSAARHSVHERFNRTRYGEGIVHVLERTLRLHHGSHPVPRNSPASGPLIRDVPAYQAA